MLAEKERKAFMRERGYRIETTIPLKEGKYLDRHLQKTGDKRGVWLRRLIIRALAKMRRSENGNPDDSR